MKLLAGHLRRRFFVLALAVAWLFMQGLPPALAAGADDGSSAVNSFIPLMFALGVILLASRAGGAIARRLHQPRVLGQLLVGLLLGPTVLDMLHWGVLQGVDLQHTIKELAELGVLLLMFNIGLEVHLSELAKVGKVAVFAGVLGVVVPIALTVLVVIPAGYGVYPALFAGVTLAATSVSISAQVLLELGYLHTKEGNALLATALIDDVLAILAVSLTLVLAAAQSSEGGADLSQLPGHCAANGWLYRGGIRAGLVWLAARLPLDSSATRSCRSLMASRYSRWRRRFSSAGQRNTSGASPLSQARLSLASA